MEKYKNLVINISTNIFRYRSIILKENEEQFAKRLSNISKTNITIDDIKGIEKGNHDIPINVIFSILIAMQLDNKVIDITQCRDLLFLANAKIPDNIEHEIKKHMNE